MITDGPHGRLAKGMLDALLAGNAARAHVVANGALDEGVRLVELFDHVLAPALRTVGMRWQDGLVRHTQERFATAAAVSLVDRIAGPPPRDPHAQWLVATAAGDDHQVGVRMSAATLAASGATVNTAFAQTLPELLAAAKSARGVCLSCSGPWSVVPARQAAQQIAATGTPVLLGGGGWQGWQEPPAIRLIGSMAELAGAARARAAVA